MASDPMTKNIPDEHRDVPLEEVPAPILADMLRDLAGRYADMAAVADTLRNYIEAATARLDEGEFEKAAQTIRRAAVLLADAEAPQKSNGA